MPVLLMSAGKPDVPPRLVRSVRLAERGRYLGGGVDGSPVFANAGRSHVDRKRDVPPRSVSRGRYLGRSGVG